MLDTNICIYLIKQKPMAVVERLRSYEPGDVAVSSISVAELKCGVCRSNRPDQNRAALAEFLLPLKVVAFGEGATDHYGDIRNHLEKGGEYYRLDGSAHRSSCQESLSYPDNEQPSRIPESTRITR
jgi:tRNA(fMet)-specific endonuclease VapC